MTFSRFGQISQISAVKCVRYPYIEVQLAKAANRVTQALALREAGDRDYIRHMVCHDGQIFSARYIFHDTQTLRQELRSRSADQYGFKSFHWDWGLTAWYSLIASMSVLARASGSRKTSTLITYRRVFCWISTGIELIDIICRIGLVGVLRERMNSWNIAIRLTRYKEVNDTLQIVRRYN